jgi:hypothetical protein
MSKYPVTKAASAIAVGETEYGIGPTVTFTKFTSCLGVICKIKDSSNVIGVHLVLIDSEGHKFTKDDVPAIEKVLTDNGAELDTGWVVGCLDKWSGEVKTEFYKLFEDFDGDRIMNSGDGVYSATVKEGKVVVTHTA